MNLSWPTSVPAQVSSAIHLMDTDPSDDWIFPQTLMDGVGDVFEFDTGHSGIGRLESAMEKLVSEARKINVPVMEVE